MKTIYYLMKMKTNHRFAEDKLEIVDESKRTIVLEHCKRHNIDVQFFKLQEVLEE